MKYIAPILFVLAGGFAGWSIPVILQANQTRADVKVLKEQVQALQLALPSTPTDLPAAVTK